MATDEAQVSETKPVEEVIPDPIVRKHETKIGRNTLKYTTTVGKLPIRNEKGEQEAALFFTAYTLDGAKPGERPLTFTFNGGPGSASVWLHMGGLGPKRVEMLDDGGMPKPPFKVVDNEYSWLESTDLVFIDPVDTGFSRATTDELGKKAKDVEGDIASIGEFIRLYLSRYKRWSSPLFLSGESYGTYRSAGLAGYLVERGIAFNGIVLISSVLHMQTLRFGNGNDLPYQLYLPTYAATAWYHGKIDQGPWKGNIRAFLDEVEAWVEAEYVPALSQGDRLNPETRAGIIARLSAYTSLSKEYLELADIRIDIMRFCKELRRTEGITVGRLDSRFKGFEREGTSENPDHDPSLAAIRPPFTTAINAYIREELGYESDLEYHILRGLDWNWGGSEKGYADTSEALREAFAKNPYLHLFVASGYYDLATPYYATYYTLNHMSLPNASKGNLDLKEYPVGHMVYLEKNTLEKLRDDVKAFYKNAIG